MKKIFLRTAVVLTFVGLFILGSCDQDKCKNCKLVTYESGVKTSEGTSSEYCGLDLELKENQEPTTIGTTTTQWECE